MARNISAQREPLFGTYFHVSTHIFMQVFEKRHIIEDSGVEMNLPQEKLRAYEKIESKKEKKPNQKKGRFLEDTILYADITIAKQFRKDFYRRRMTAIPFDQEIRMVQSSKSGFSNSAKTMNIKEEESQSSPSIENFLEDTILYADITVAKQFRKDFHRRKKAIIPSNR